MTWPVFFNGLGLSLGVKLVSTSDRPSVFSKIFRLFASGGEKKKCSAFCTNRLEVLCRNFRAKIRRSGLPMFNIKAISYTVGFRQLKTALLDWTFLRLDSSGPSSYRQSSRFYSFCVLPRGCWCEGVLLCCCMAVENRLAALRFARYPRATRASRATNPRPGALVALHISPKPPNLRLWRCTQPRAAKATAGVAAVGKMASIPRAAVVV